MYSALMLFPTPLVHLLWTPDSNMNKMQFMWQCYINVEPEKWKTMELIQKICTVTDDAILGAKESIMRPRF